MSGVLHDQAKLYRRLPDGDDGAAQQEQAFAGTVGACAGYLRGRPEAERDCFFAELATGARLSAVEIERIAVEEEN